jgi:flagellar protein FliS
MRKGINAYKKTSIESSVAYADAHQLIEMLLTAGINNIAKSIGHIDRGEQKEKGECLMKSFDIVQALKQSLSKDSNEIRDNLSDLYDYSIDNIMKGNLNSDIENLKSVSDVLKTIREGWRSIPQSERGKKSDGVITTSISDGYKNKKT